MKRNLYSINKLSCRHIDNIFMKTSQTVEEVNVELNKAQNKDINIKVQSAINKYVYFLDLTIANEN